MEEHRKSVDVHENHVVYLIFELIKCNIVRRA
jgi:hypothetical protein